MAVSQWLCLPWPTPSPPAHKALPASPPAFKQSPPAIPALGTNVKKRRHGDEDTYYMHVSVLCGAQAGAAGEETQGHWGGRRDHSHPESWGPELGRQQGRKRRIRLQRARPDRARLQGNPDLPTRGLWVTLLPTSEVLL